jgi:hypothetical protein
MGKVFDKDGNKLNPNAGNPELSSGLSSADLAAGKKPQQPKKDAEPAKGYVRVKMNKDANGSLDGVRSQAFLKGEEYDLPLHLYNDFVSLEAVDAGLDKKDKDEKAAKEKLNEKAHKDAPKNK